MKKTLFTMLMSVVMVLVISTCAFAFTDNQQSEIISVLEEEGFLDQVYYLNVPGDIKVKSADSQLYVDELTVGSKGEPQYVDAMATLDMTVVKDAYDTFTGVVNNLFEIKYPEEISILNDEFDRMIIAGEVIVSISIPEGMDVPDDVVIGDGFSDNVSVFFDKVTEEISNGNVVITFKIKDGMTKADLDKSADYLDDFTLLCKNLSVTDMGVYELSGTVEGEIRVVCPKAYETAHTIRILAVNDDESTPVTEYLYVTDESKVKLTTLSIVEDSIISYQNPVEPINDQIILQDLSSTDNYTVNLEITGVTTTTTQFSKYADGETPYVVERIIPMGGYTGAISDIQINGTSIDYVVEDGVVKAYTDLINADGVNIKVFTTDATLLKAWIGEGKSNEPGSFTVNGKVDQIISNEFGVLVSKNGQYDNIVSSSSHTGNWDESTTLSFKAPIKNKNGVFVMHFDQLDYGTYYFAVYTKNATDMRYDIRDANQELVIYSYQPEPIIPSRPGTSTPVTPEPTTEGKVIANINGQAVEYALDDVNLIYVTSITVPEVEGKLFEGWYYDALFTNAVGDSIKVADGETVHIYAKFVNATTPDKFETSDEHFAYIIGYPDGTVRPENNISREEIATIFYRLMTDEYRDSIASQINDFADVEVDRWSNRAISTMANGGYIKGYNGKFKPEDAITRAEFVTIAARFLETENEATSNFTDVENHWAKEYIDVTSQALWINGYEDGTFRPDNYITRAEAMAIFNRILCRRVDEEGLVSGVLRFPDVADTAWYVYEVLEATNSHKCVREEGEVYENWTELLPNRDWTKY